MDNSKYNLDDEYFGGQSGFNFDFNLAPPSTNFPSFQEPNKYDLLKSDGLSEAAETRIEDRFPSLNIQDQSSFDTVKKGKDDKTSAAETIDNMILNVDYSLSSFKGKDEKVELLNAAIRSHDGNAILTVVLFLRRTLKKSIFQREIMKFTDAVNMYLSYLEEDHEMDELSNMLLLLDRTEDAAMLKYDAGISTQQADRKIKWIENCLNTHFQPGMVDKFYTESLYEHHQLIKDQIVLEDHRFAESSSESETFEVFQQLTSRKRLLDSPAMSSLIFCVLYHYGVPEIAAVSPTSIKSRFNLSKKQFTWGAMKALAFSQRWDQIQDLFLTKNWLRGSKMRSCIGFVKVVQMLSKMKAPNEVIANYVSHVEDQNTKLELAKKHQCHSLVFELLKNNKDRKGLLDYRSSLPQHSVDYINASDIINSTAIKWKN